jgi:hypothetical protein
MLQLERRPSRNRMKIIHLFSGWGRGGISPSSKHPSHHRTHPSSVIRNLSPVTHDAQHHQTRLSDRAAPTARCLIFDLVSSRQGWDSTNPSKWGLQPGGHSPQHNMYSALSSASCRQFTAPRPLSPEHLFTPSLLHSFTAPMNCPLTTGLRRAQD